MDSKKESNKEKISKSGLDEKVIRLQLDAIDTLIDNSSFFHLDDDHLYESYIHSLYALGANDIETTISDAIKSASLQCAFEMNSLKRFTPMYLSIFKELSYFVGSNLVKQSLKNSNLPLTPLDDDYINKAGLSFKYYFCDQIGADYFDNSPAAQEKRHNYESRWLPAISELAINAKNHKEVEGKENLLRAPSSEAIDKFASDITEFYMELLLPLDRYNLLPSDEKGDYLSTYFEHTDIDVSQVITEEIKHSAKKIYGDTKYSRDSVNSLTQSISNKLSNSVFDDLCQNESSLDDMMSQYSIIDVSRYFKASLSHKLNTYLNESIFDDDGYFIDREFGKNILENLKFISESSSTEPQCESAYCEMAREYTNLLGHVCY